MHKTTVTRNGQITIPKELRDKFGIVEGIVIEIEEVKEGILFRIPSWIDELAGKGNGNPEEIKKELDRLREEPV